MASETLEIDAGESRVPALLERPSAARAVYVLAHGAGAGMRHPFLGAVSAGLAAQGVATLRYEFPYMAARRSRPDPQPILLATVRAAVVAAGALGLPVVAGGKSFGGRMTSTAEAAQHLDGVRGIAFLGFPLHPPGHPATTRADHLKEVKVPLLFLQGTRDEFADLELLRGVLQGRRQTTLHVVDGADHGFRVPKRSGRTEPEVLAELVTTIVRWAYHVLGVN